MTAMRKISTFLALIVGANIMAGCGFQGMQEMSLPGGVGAGPDAIRVTVELPDVGTLTTNGQVKVSDIAVGTITDIKVADWHAVATVSLAPGTKLPANAVARVGVNSLLGASYLELSAPTNARPRGALASGDTIPLDRGSAYPATEQVLSAASVVLNGGGLEQLSTITSELNKALSGKDMAVRELLPRLNSFVSALDSQKVQIYDAIDSMDTLAARFADNREVITRSIDQLGPALAVLSRERPKLTQTLRALQRLGSVATPLVRATRADIVANLRDLVPTLRALHGAGDSLARGLGFAITFPFAPETLSKACRGDYCNLDLTLDLTKDALVNGFTTPDGAPTLPGLPGLPTLAQLGQLLSTITVGMIPAPIGSVIGEVLGGLPGGTPSPSPHGGSSPSPSPSPGPLPGLPLLTGLPLHLTRTTTITGGEE